MENTVNMIAGTSILIFIILFIRRLFWKKCNPNVLYFLWLFVALRILLPVNIPFVLHDENINKILSQKISINSDAFSEHVDNTSETNALTDIENAEDFTEDKNVYYSREQRKERQDLAVESDKMEKTQMTKKQGLKTDTILFIIWCCGSLSLTVYFVLVNFYVFRNVKKRGVGLLNQRVGIYEVEGHNCLVGIWKPQIFMDPQILNHPIYKRFVLLHEMEHYRIKDNLWLLVRNICLILQWFNPFVWIAYFKVQEDCELACDYRVLSGLNPSEKESYLETLLYILELNQKKVYFASPAANRTGAVKKRLNGAYTKRKPLISLIVLFFAGIITAATFLKVNISGETITDKKIMTEQYDTTVSQDEDKENGEPLDVMYIENIKDVERGTNLNYLNCYTTDITRAGNHYWIDENHILWGTGTSEYGQLGEVKEDLSVLTNPKEIARNVKHVDFSGEYFVIFITDDNRLYGLGGNPAGVLQEASKDDFNSTYMNVVTEPVLIMEHVVFAKCGYSTIIALSEDGDVYVMGNNGYSSFSNEQYYAPEKVMENAKYVTAYFHTYAVICNDNSLWTWGDNRLGQCGIGSFSVNVESPQKVMEDVDCAWMGRAAFNSRNVVPEQDNLIILKKDGNYYGCGEGIGTNLVYDTTDDFDELHVDDMAKVEASSDFQMIKLQEFENVSSEKNVEMSTLEEVTTEDVKVKNSWYQKTKLVTEDMELRELTEEELERITKLQQKLFKGLSDEEVEEIKEKLWEVHGGLEGDIVYYDRGTLTNPNPEAWQWINDTIPDDNVDDGHWGPEVIEVLEEVKAQLADDRVIKLITEAQDEIQAIMDEHKSEHVMKAHMILHDLDYWLFQYPVADFEYAPADWNGIYIYYGELDGILQEY